jgi:carbon-monoxide dehydrogenase small subunit
MEIKINVNGKMISEQIEPDLLLIDFLRNHGCYSVKRGCETSGCGLCTVLMDDTPYCPALFWLQEPMDIM